MKKKEKIALVLSFLVFLIPFLGIPNNVQDIVVSIFGISIFALIFCGNYFEKVGDSDILDTDPTENFEQKVPEFDESEPEVDIENEKALEKNFESEEYEKELESESAEESTYKAIN